ncbi:hypothetical protein K1X84_09960 [bacterium]|nr:hypothetical protein [bacterium]
MELSISKKLHSIIFTLMIVLINSCATVYLNADGVEKNVSMTNTDRKFTIVRHFNKSIKATFMIFDLATVNNPDVAKAINDELISAKGDAVTNLKIKGQMTFVDGLVPFSLGFIGAVVAPPYGGYISVLIGLRTYTIEGDVIQYTE